MPDLHRSSGANRSWEGRTRFQHWYRDNQVYFITARCRDRYPAFAADETKAIFWKQFKKYTAQFEFVPWVTSLLDNHYHTIGYLRYGKNLGVMMQRIHGSVAKLVNDVLSHQVTSEKSDRKHSTLNGDHRLVPFWVDTRHKNYFDGCLRDEKQGRLTYRYVLTQCRRHRICDDYRNYPHTQVEIDMEPAIRRATELKAFLYGVPYKRYMGGGES